jgi:K+-sensing histidine kinase KdpD
VTRTTTAWLVGLVPSTLAVGVCRVLEVDSDVTAALPIVPVAAAGLIGGRRLGIRIAAVAGVIYSVALLAPFGHFRIGLTRDVLVVTMFVTVAFVAGALADRRRVEPTAEATVVVRAASSDPSMLLRAVSHDLRNPLSTIRAASTDLLSGRHVDDAARQEELLGLVVNESERLDRLVGNLLSAGRAHAGKLEPRVAPEVLAVVVGDSLSRLRQLHPHHLVMQVDDALPEVLVDAVQIDQVVTNLVENAARMSPPASTITVSAHSDDAWVVVTVDDDGPGFAPTAEDPFDPYVSSTGSSGLGLAICKAIVHAHGGAIEVVRPPRALGGTVRFTVPIAARTDGTSSARCEPG